MDLKIYSKKLAFFPLIVRGIHKRALKGIVIWSVFHFIKFIVIDAWRLDYIQQISELLNVK